MVLVCYGMLNTAFWTEVEKAKVFFRDSLTCSEVAELGNRLQR